MSNFSNRDYGLLNRFVGAFEEANRQDKTTAGKVFRKERLELEKVAGGKKRLDEADAVLADAARAARELVGDAQREIAGLMTATRARIETMNGKLAVREQSANDVHAAQVTMREELLAKERDIEQDVRAMTKRAGEANARDIEIDKRETAVVAREAAAAAREDQVNARARRMTEAAA